MWERYRSLTFFSVQIRLHGRKGTVRGSERAGADIPRSFISRNVRNKRSGARKEVALQKSTFVHCNYSFRVENDGKKAEKNDN